MTEWAQGIDWGNAPSWVAAGTAVVATIFALLNLRTARKAYVDGKWNQKVAQARLVWGEVGAPSGTSTGGRVKLLDGVTGPGESPSEVLVGDRPGLLELDHNGRTYIATEDIVIFPVHVTNNSAEPIGGCFVTLESGPPVRPGASGDQEVSTRWHHHLQREAIRVLPPNKTVSLDFVAPVALETVNLTRTRVIVLFGDSAGLRWKRVDTRPPTEVPQRIRSSRRAAWFRTSRKKSHRR